MDIRAFIDKQLAQWPEAQMCHDDLARIRAKTLLVNGIKIKVQYNPARERSTTAKTDAASVKNRPCFLCPANRPKEQIAMPWEAYNILVNPYPILPRHLTVATKKHVPQSIPGKIPDMLDLAKSLDGFIILYNGPQCGASAPDHFHFQAVESGHTPIERAVDYWIRTPASSILGKVAIREKLSFSGIHLLMSGHNPKEISDVFTKIYQTMISRQYITDEPKMNIICRYTKKLWHLLLIPRTRHRPDRFYAEGDAQILISPGTIDMAGVIVTPRESDFEQVTSTDIERIYKEVAFFELPPFIYPHDSL
jgi:ATP adenylyltransferase/5',5'''-P-1,P-4-tetraphosphate phosphorylase II